LVIRIFKGWLKGAKGSLFNFQGKRVGKKGFFFPGLPWFKGFLGKFSPRNWGGLGKGVISRVGKPRKVPFWVGKGLIKEGLEERAP